ncbi:hypothetical protein ZWY2020_009934 [Hordeum vulgare]|nr:hypothetical protein ZWY2020_009934 [Hordeum vulgare]
MSSRRSSASWVTYTEGQKPIQMVSVQLYNQLLEKEITFYIAVSLGSRVIPSRRQAGTDGTPPPSKTDKGLVNLPNSIQGS